MFGYQKVGGLHFIRVGRFGASFYATRKAVGSPVIVSEWTKAVAVALVAFIAVTSTAMVEDKDAFNSCIEQLAQGNPAVTGCRG